MRPDLGQSGSMSDSPWQQQAIQVGEARCRPSGTNCTVASTCLVVAISGLAKQQRRGFDSMVSYADTRF